MTQRICGLFGEATISGSVIALWYWRNFGGRDGFWVYGGRRDKLKALPEGRRLREGTPSGDRHASLKARLYLPTGRQLPCSKATRPFYENGQLTWLADQPQVASARIIVTVLEEAPATVKRRTFPTAIAGQVQILDDIVSPIVDEDDWECLK